MSDSAFSPELTNVTSSHSGVLVDLLVVDDVGGLVSPGLQGNDRNPQVGNDK